jgi:hypothetical protein
MFGRPWSKPSGKPDTSHMPGYARPVLDGSNPGSADPAGRLVAAIDRAAQAGWAETARLAALIAMLAAAVALVIMAGR